MVVRLDSEEEREITAACRAGQPDAFGALVRRFQDRLYPTIVRLTGCPAEALDVLQDTFLKAFEKLDAFQGESRLYTWVYRIAVNQALSGRRKRRSTRSAENLDGGADDSRLTAREDDPSADLVRDERETAVRRALAALAPEHRAVVVLKEYDDLSYEEISGLLGIPIGTVRSRLHRARLELKELLRDWVADEIEEERHAATRADAARMRRL